MTYPQAAWAPLLYVSPLGSPVKYGRCRPACPETLGHDIEVLASSSIKQAVVHGGPGVVGRSCAGNGGELSEENIRTRISLTESRSGCYCHHAPAILNNVSK